MIITKSKTFGEIKSKLKKSDKIGIVSCNACAKMCDTGGEKNMKKLSVLLKKNGFCVADMDLIGVACDYDQLKKDELKGNTTIVLACDSGVYNLKKLFPKRKIISALKTIGLGAFNHKGKISLVRKFG
jgi:hypothetical protein